MGAGFEKLMAPQVPGKGALWEGGREFFVPSLLELGCVRG